MISKRLKSLSIIGLLGLSACLSGCKSDGSSSSSESTAVAESTVEKATYSATIAADTETVYVQKMGELWTIKVNDATITQAEYYLYLIQYVYNHGYKLNNITDAIVSSAADSTIFQIRLDELEYEAAKKDKDIEISEDDIASSKTNAKKFIDFFGLDLLNEYYITEQMVYDLFEKQIYVSKHSEKMITDISKKYYDEYEKKYEEITFHNMYYALFPFYEFGDDGQPKKDSSGNYVMVSDEEKMEIKKKAEEFQKRAADGEKMEDLVKEYGIETYSDTQINYNGAYTDQLNALVESLNEGDISDVFDAESGYMIVRMDKKSDGDYKTYWLQYISYQQAQKDINEEQQKFVKDANLSEDDINDNVIMFTDLYTICRRMVAHGIITDETTTAVSSETATTAKEEESSTK